MESMEKELEYAAFVWHKERERYEMVGRPVISRKLAEDRLQERVQSGYMDGYDTEKIVYKKRVVEIHMRDWENI